ncbi:MAG TPA: hypothetical protein VMZ28_28625 [Kofleriaceae bacterium]|nr:hypothetical protein [Kofleriaceae bacterium]
MSARLVVANLDAEIVWAREATPGPHPGVSPEAARRIAAAGRLLEVFCEAGDRLWVHGDPPPGPAEHILPWAATTPNPIPTPTPIPSTSTTTRNLAWQTIPDANAARAVNHRRFAFELAQAKGWALPGARMIRALAELDLPAPWVAKAPYSAAGRERVRHLGGPVPAARLERLLARFGELLVEPWVERLADLGCAGIGARVFPPHRLDNDDAGAFRAAVIEDDAADWPDERRALQGTAEQAAQALADAGYRGPFAVDAYVYRDPATGAPRLQRMSELNARLTFGLVERVRYERAAGCAR